MGRSVIALFMVGFLAIFSAFWTGVVGCWRRSPGNITATAILMLFACQYIFLDILFSEIPDAYSLSFCFSRNRRRPRKLNCKFASIHKNSGNFIYMYIYCDINGICLFICRLGLLSAGGMGLWHGVEYYEKEKIVGEEYYQQWSNVSTQFYVSKILLTI